MKAGILTFHLAYNYGAVLQTYGLQQTLMHMGIQASVLDYRPRSLLVGNRPLGLRSGRFMHVLPMRWKFDRFRKRHLNLTRRLSTAEDIKEATSNYDAVIVGSDQVWNTNITRDDYVQYFLGFIGDVKKISYAADFGESHQDSNKRPLMEKMLSDFDHISVRTDLSRKMVKELCGRKAAIVLDPTFLTDFSEVYSNIKLKSPFILVYSIWDDVNIKTLATLVQTVKSQFKLPVYSVSQMTDFPNADRHLRKIGPAEWLTYFQKAAFICTDSYHGTIFAIKNRKPFISVAINKRSSRIVEVCSRYDLKGHVVTSSEKINPCLLTKSPIDYDQVHRLTSNDIELSINFLKQALSCESQNKD